MVTIPFFIEGIEPLTSCAGIGVSAVALDPIQQNQISSPVSLSPKGLSKLGCGLEGQTADKVLADRC